MSKKQHALFGVIGLGRFGFALAKTLAELGSEVLVLDGTPEKVRDAAAFTEHAFMVEALHKEALQEAGIQNCDTVIVCIGEKIDTSILTTLNVIAMGVPHVIAKAISPEHGFVLEKLGAEVVYPDHDMAVRLGNRLVTSQIMEYISLSSEVDISELMLTERVSGKTVLELDLRKNYGLNIIAVKHEGETQIEVEPHQALYAGDVIVVAGKRESIRRFAHDLTA